MYHVLSNKLGLGSVCPLQVLLGRWKGACVAVKVMAASDVADAIRVADFQQEAEMLCALRHANILDFYGACFNAHSVSCQQSRVTAAFCILRMRKGPDQLSAVRADDVCH